MVTQPRTILLLIGAAKIEFIVQRSLVLGNSADVTITMTNSGKVERFQSLPTIIALDDLRRLAEYIETALNEEIDYEYLPLNLGFEFYAYDNDDYVTTVNLFLLSAETEGERRSYVGCQGPVLNDMLTRFANQLKECAK